MTTSSSPPFDPNDARGSTRQTTRQPVIYASASTLRTACILSAVALAAGPFLAWLVADTALGTSQAAGIDSTLGWFSVAAGVVAAWSCFSGQFQRGSVALLFGLGISLSEYVRLKEGLYSISFEMAKMRPGLGLYMCLIGSVVGSVAGLTAATRG